MISSPLPITRPLRQLKRLLRGLGELGAPVLRRDEHDHRLRGHARVARLGALLVDAVQLVDRHVPPVGVLAHERHRLLADAADHDRDARQRRGQLLALGDVEPRAVVVELLARPARLDHVERLAHAVDALGRCGRRDAERVELVDHRTPAQRELEAAARHVVERDRLARQHHRVAERVAQHQVALRHALGRRGQPGGRGHRLVHRLVERERRREVVHARHHGEARGLRRLRAGDEPRRVHPHLREEESELDGRITHGGTR